jgi:hypothetical protein
MAKTASPEVIDLISRKNPDLLEYIQAEEIKKEKPRMLPFVDMPAEAGQKSPPTERRTELSVPAFEHEFEYYDWYMAQDSKSLNDADRVWIADYMKTDQWEKFYGKKQTIGGEG